MFVSRTFPPSQYPRVNGANPLSRGLCFLLGGAVSSFVDCTAGRFGAASGTVAPIVSSASAGAVAQFSHSGTNVNYSYLNFGTHPACVDLGLNPTTWAFYARDRSGAAGGLAERNDGNTISAGWGIMKVAATGAIQFERENSSSNLKMRTDAPVWADTTSFHSIVITHTGGGTASDVAIYFDGVKQAISEIAALHSGSSGSDAAYNLYLGRSVYQSVGCFGGEIAVAAFAKRVWTPAEAVAFASNPWGIFAPSPPRSRVLAPTTVGKGGFFLAM